MEGENNTMEMRINRLPAITWNRMDINDIPVNLPKFAGAELAFDTNLDEKQATHDTASDAAQAMYATTESAEQATHATVSNSKWATCATTPLPISTGAGAAADAVFEGLPVYNLSVNKGETAETKAEYLGAGDQGAVLQVTAGDDSQITLYTHVKPAENANAALRILLKLGKNAKLRLVELLEPAQNAAMLHDLGGELGDGAEVEVLHLYLGSGDLYSGCRMDLIGEEAKFTYQAGYLGRNQQFLDVNLISNHIGKNTTCNLRADGTLKDQAQKTFRGTIDFKKGCKGSVGAEQENVLLLGEDIVNKTIPLILCAEEDVQGDHGATIGELDEDNLFFFAARGIDPVTAENILTREKLNRLAESVGREDMKILAQNAIEEVL